jgi:hypothetical protein
MAIEVLNTRPSIDPRALPSGDLFVDVFPGGWRTYLKVEINGEPYVVHLGANAEDRPLPQLGLLEDLDLHHPILVIDARIEVEPGYFGVAAPGSDLRNGTVIDGSEAKLLCVTNGASKLLFNLATGAAVQEAAEKTARYPSWQLSGSFGGERVRIGQSPDRTD